MDRRRVRRRHAHEDLVHARHDSRRALRRARPRGLRSRSGVQPGHSGHVPGRAGRRAEAAQHLGEWRGLRRAGHEARADVRRELQDVRRRRDRGSARRGTECLMPFEAVIGLEIHAQLLTASKMFCGCSAAFGAGPNTHICPVCLGLPGALPVLNRAAVDYAIRAALALNCAVQERSIFARKNYFYPDLPKGYQISQYELPLALGGVVAANSDDWAPGYDIRITRIHMEEDAGKLLHEGFLDSDRLSY